ncbi:MAG: energy-coupling factor ABC transporter ATP-binding protein [Thermodesulfobacteriota bacterium]|nr:energy-coupling factor ABC transporter ATP-binding protein [Thermodesulfobacteriota bacterium]
MDKPPTLIELQGINFTYSGENAVLQDLDFTFHKDDRVGLLAPNGSGKTTFFHIIMGLLKPDRGNIYIFGRPVHSEKDFAGVRQRIGLLFQDSDDQLFCPTVLEDVAFGPLNMGYKRQAAIAIARETLATVGFSGYENRITYKLSGGEKRMIALAAVLAMKPEVLLLDEPLTGLDTKTRKVLHDILMTLNLPYIIISHDIDFLGATTRSIYTLEDGRIYLDSQIHYHRHEHAHVFGNRPHRHD